VTDPLSNERIEEIVGQLSAERILQIIDSGANERELVEARLLAQTQDARYTEKPGVRTAIVHQLYDILRADLIDRGES